MKNSFHEKEFGVTNYGLKLDFLPFIDFKAPSNLDLYLSNKILLLVILYNNILNNILIIMGVKIIIDKNLPYFFW